MARIYDLRSFIEVLKEKGSFERITRPVSLDHELANVGAALARQGGKAVLFETVTGSEDLIHWPVFTNAVVSPMTGVPMAPGSLVPWIPMPWWKSWSSAIHHSPETM